MKIGKHGLRDHARILAPLFCLIAGIWGLRIIFAAANSPAWIIHITSVTTATSVAVLLAVLLIHLRQFGGYTSVVVAALLLNAWSQLLVVAAIEFTAVTHLMNVYAAPEYSIPGRTEAHLEHIYGHLTFGIGIGSLVGAAFGCLLLLILRVLMPAHPAPVNWEAKVR